MLSPGACWCVVARRYERVLVKQMEERKQRERQENLQREEMAEIIHKDVAKFKEEAEMMKRKHQQKILHANEVCSLPPPWTVLLPPRQLLTVFCRLCSARCGDGGGSHCPH